MGKTWPSRALIALVMGVLSFCATNAARAQTSETYKVRLTPVPIDASMMSTIAGSGSLTAVLTGNKLMISGSFAGLRSPAIDAHIHRAPKGIRGPGILDVQVTATQPSGTMRTNRYEGEIRHSVDLNAEQIDDLRNGRLYIQIDSEGAPEGNLWGWILR